MELLKIDDYDKALVPLKEVTINNFFARSVIENKAEGRVYVDNTDDPKTFYVVHKYGMSLLFGDSDNSTFNDSFLSYAINLNQTRNSIEWLQAFPEKWNKRLQSLFADRFITSEQNTLNPEKRVVELNTRLNFTFNPKLFSQRKKTSIDNGIELVHSNKQHFATMKGSVTPAFFWKSADEFLTHGIGFSLIYQGKLAATAFSAFIIDNYLEIGIETIPEYRGKGFAEMVCAALIDYCISNNFIPVWACRLENTGSVKLAQKLGFEISKRIPYYKININS